MSVFPVPVPIIREQKPAFQAHIHKSEYVARKMHTNVRVTSFSGMNKKVMESWGVGPENAIVDVIL